MRVYKKTLIVSFVVCCILAILSAILNIWNEFKWISFVVNWCVGIACSVVVVIITTYIQYRAEKYKITIELAIESLAWLNEFYSLKDLLDKNERLKEKANSEEFQKNILALADKYFETTYRCFSLSCEYVSFSKKSTEANKRLNYAFSMVHKLCSSKEYNEKPLQLVKKLKFQINIVGFLEDLDAFLKYDDFQSVKIKLDELIEKRNINNLEVR